MSTEITVAAPMMTVVALRSRLEAADGIEVSEIDDWNSRGTSLDAPFNPENQVAALVALTIIVSDEVGDQRLADELANADAELLLLDPRTSAELGRIGPTDTATDVAAAIGLTH